MCPVDASGFGRYIDIYFGLNLRKFRMMVKVKWNIVWGIGVIIVFTMLFAIRLGVFEKAVHEHPVVAKPGPPKLAESWMSIYQNKQKIGFIHRKFRPLEKGGYHGEEQVTMHINTMGVTQPIHLSTETELNPDMSFSSFNFELNSSLFRFFARGYAGKDQLIVFSGPPHSQTKTVFPIKDLPRISGNIYEAAFAGSLEKDQSSEFSIFDPSTMSMRKMKVTRYADEVIPIMNKRVFTQKYCTDFMDVKNCAWLEKSGEVVKESGILGLTMEKVTPEIAREGMSSFSGADFTEIASIPSNIKIDNPSQATKLEIRIGGLPVNYILAYSRQTFTNHILVITKERLVADGNEDSIPTALNRFLESSALVQSDDPRILSTVSKITAPSDTRLQKVQKITAWVYKHITKKPVLSVPNALEVLNNKEGDCNEHAVLTAALLRAAGIPAQIEAGLVYLNGRFYYHAWNSAYLGKWITLDSVFNQIPADVTHLRLARGEGSEQLDLLGVMGKIRLEVISVSYD